MTIAMTLNIPKIELTDNKALIFTAFIPAMHQDLAELWELLSDQEKMQARKFINDYLKDRYVIAHGLLRHLLSFYVAVAPRDIQYRTNQFGKPFLMNGSDNSNSRVQFNMSHSKDYAAYIIALDYQVGIDIEWQDKDIKLQEISELVLSPLEVMLFNQLNSRGKFRAFYDIWTKKEAIIKAVGQGLSYPITTIEIIHLIGNNTIFYETKGNTFYISGLLSLKHYAGAVAITHKLDQLIHTDIANHRILHY